MAERMSAQRTPPTGQQVPTSPRSANLQVQQRLTPRRDRFPAAQPGVNNSLAKIPLWPTGGRLRPSQVPARSADVDFRGGVEAPASREHGSGGRHRLDSPLCRQMEEQFQADFTQVRVHTDDGADRSARALGARAYSVGTDIFFGRGQYAPHTAVGARLLAHELVHVMQPVSGRGRSARAGSGARGR